MCLETKTLWASSKRDIWVVQVGFAKIRNCLWGLIPCQHQTDKVNQAAEELYPHLCCSWRRCCYCQPASLPACQTSPISTRFQILTCGLWDFKVLGKILFILSSTLFNGNAYWVIQGKQRRYCLQNDRDFAYPHLEWVNAQYSLGIKCEIILD